MATAAEVKAKAAGETRNVAIDYSDKLDSGELLTGAPSVSVTGMTASNQSVNSTELTIQGDAVAAGKAVTFTLAGGTAGTSYLVTVTVSTDATNAQTFEDVIKVDVT